MNVDQFHYFQYNVGIYFLTITNRTYGCDTCWTDLNTTGKCNTFWTCVSWLSYLQMYVSTAHENAHVCHFRLLIGALCKASVYIRICGHKH